MTIKKYDPQIIESKWKKIWEVENLYRTQIDPDKPKAYCLDMFPYPSGNGLSVGHCRNYVPTDVYARFKKMQGYSVLHPMGWDAFGLPAENEALKKQIHPTVIVPKHTANYKRQMNLVSISYDWEKEINSSNPSYYRWTQWLFLLLYQRGLAYRARGPQWWCPNCKTILANEQVEKGLCWRCGKPVEQKELEQWYFKITAYADALLNELDQLDWPEHILTMQKNWIGRSEGLDICFKVAGAELSLQTYTTRPDTLFGVTFLVVGLEHPLLQKIVPAERAAAVQAYVKETMRKSDIERAGSRGGMDTGAEAIHPLTGQRIPIWVAEYVVQSYGSGVVMGVPAHDRRDFEFAQTHHLPITVVVEPPNKDEVLQEAYVEAGCMINSGKFNGLSNLEAAREIGKELEALGLAAATVRYRMRDWLISRQRYWGAPIPIVHCESCGIVPVPEDRLPVALPYVEHYEPTGSPESPLAGIPDFVNTVCPACGRPARRETDTLDGFACSSWYFLRFPDRDYDQGPFNPQLVDCWLPVDVYVGGAEHAVMHLLYARFWTKVMNDAGLVKFREPFPRLKSQGVVMGRDGSRMSKSKGNVITPDEVVGTHGADSLRLYELFVAPFDKDILWSDEDVVGMDRFLKQVWRLVQEEAAPSSSREPAEDEALLRQLHKTIRKVTLDIEGFKFNTAVSTLMEWVNSATAYKNKFGNTDILLSAFPEFLKLLAPMAPHIAEELWRVALHRTEPIGNTDWPKWDTERVKDKTFQVPVQINGKARVVLDVPENITRDELYDLALANGVVQKWLAGKQVQTTFYVSHRVFNIVAGG